MSSSWSVLAKLAVGSAAVLLLSLGLCGIAIATNKGETMADVALAGMGLGGAGLVLAGVAAVVMSVVASFRSPKPPPPPPPRL